MALSYELISQFAKLAVGDNKKSTESVVYGTVKIDAAGNKYVELDNSKQSIDLADNNQPIFEPNSSTVVTANENDRVSVLIKDHTATVTGNISSPAAQEKEVILIKDYIQAETVRVNELIATKAEVGALDAATAEIEVLKADKASITDLNAANAKIDSLNAEIAGIDTLIANKADIGDLNAVKADIVDLEAATAEIEVLKTNKASIEDLTAAKAEIGELVAKKIDTEVVIADDAILDNIKSSAMDVVSLIADKATIEELINNKANINTLIAENAALKYANIDFSNIGEAAIKNMFSETGLIKDLVVGDSTITGELVGVTIKGDRIEVGTLKADRLVVKGSDGNYYALSTDFTAMPGVTPVEEDSIHGSVLVKKSIVAEKIDVDDLHAFGATIGGFKIGEHSIYSGVKSSIDNTTRGFYVDNEGQLALGDNSNYIKYAKDENGNYKLNVSAVDNLTIGGRNLIQNSNNLIFEDYYFNSELRHDGAGNAFISNDTLICTHDGIGNVILSDATLDCTHDTNGNVTLTY